MTIGVLALVGVTPERVAALTAAGYAVREGKQYANRTDAVRAAADTVRAVLTNGRAGWRGDAAPGQRGRAHRARPARLSRQRRARDGRGYPGPDRRAAREAHCGGGPGCPRGGT